MSLIGQPCWMLGIRVTMLHTIGDFSLFEIVQHPGVPGPPPHHHTDCSEFFYVVKGVVEIVADGERLQLTKGESYSIPPGAVHTFANPGAAPVTFVTGFSPRGFERMFTDLAIPADRPGAREASVAPEIIARLGRDAASYNMVFAG